MWTEDYFPLSILHLRNNQVAEIAWRDGRLYFASHGLDDTKGRCDDRAVEVGFVENAPQQETRLLESAAADSLYVLTGHRTFVSHTCGQTWEEF